MYDFDTSIIEIANDFYDAYKRCREDKNIRKTEYGYISSVVNVPAIVNGSFALELYLKSMIKNDVIIKEHGLKVLFGMLDCDLSNDIREEVNKKIDNQCSFDEMLDGIDDSFLYWRYIHEKPNFGFGLKNTLKAIDTFIETFKEKANSLSSHK